MNNMGLSEHGAGREISRKASIYYCENEYVVRKIAIAVNKLWPCCIKGTVCIYVFSCGNYTFTWRNNSAAYRHLYTRTAI